MNDTPLQLTLRELQMLCSSYRFWVGLVAVVIILTIAGPFGTLSELGYAERLVYWAMIAGLTFFCGLGVSFFLGVLLTQYGIKEWPARLLGGVISGLPIAIIVWTINKYGFGMDMGGWLVFVRVLAYCTIISVSVMILYFLLKTPEQNSIETQIVIVPFIQRLPKHLGRNLLHISAQDHYVEAVTERGSYLILMRFSDALNELANMEGVQIHRAHWVALHAVNKPLRKDDKLIIETTDGKRFPVSRSHSKKVKALLNI